MKIVYLFMGALLIGCSSEHHLNELRDFNPYPEFGDTAGPHDTHWYINDDPTPYETTSSAEHVVEFHGDPSVYWYEPSGAHGMVASNDKNNDFATLIQYIRERSGGPVFIDGPLNFSSVSELESLEYATFTHVLCEFWVAPDDNPADYQVSTREVDDGLLVLLNGDYVGHVLLRDSGSWTLDVIPGQTNAIVLILVDDAADERYFDEVALTRAGVIIN